MTFFRRLRRVLRRRQSEADMAEEMRFHLEQRAADYASAGVPEENARYAAQRKFGNLGRIQEDARESRGWRWLEHAGKDLQLAVRNLAKSPGFTVLAIVTLALGIGANTSMFSALNSILLRPLPYPVGEQIDRLERVARGNRDGRVAPADFLDWQREAHRYGETAAYILRDTSLSEPGRPAELTRAMRSTINLFALLGIRPQLGRGFRSDEMVPGNDRVVILNHRCWQLRFGGRHDIVGHTVRVDGEPHTVVGVLPERFNDMRHLGYIDVFRPLAFDHELSADRHSMSVRLLGRRSPQVTKADADAWVAGFGARLAADHPEIHGGSSWHVVPLVRTILDQNGQHMLVMLIGLSGFVLLIACSNLANLLLARTIARAREFAVRSALGASRMQLLRPLIAEVLLLALAGGACALLVAMWVMDYLALRSTDDDGNRVEMAVDWHVLVWAGLASLVTAVAFGLAPALFAMRLNLNNTLKSGARGLTGGRGQQRFRSALVIGQFALAMILLAGAALFIRGVADLNERRAGWDSERLITGSFMLPKAVYPDAARIDAFHRLALERIEALPGVAAASIALYPPFLSAPSAQRTIVDGRERPPPGQEPVVVVNRVSPRYFETVGTRVIAGRVFRASDNGTAPKVAIVSLATATALFGRDGALGRRLAEAGAPASDWAEVVGVVADVQPALADAAPASYQMYLPLAQAPAASGTIAVRTQVEPSGLIDSIRNAVTAIDPDLPVRALQPADATIHRSTYQIRVLRDILAAIAVLGLALASLGVYGVIARMMAQRTSEFAIRVALGAAVGDITRIVLKSGVRLACIGSALGLLGAVGVSRLIASGFPGMHFESPPVLIGATLVLVAVGLLACWLPARRARQVDPVVALRAE